MLGKSRLDGKEEEIRLLLQKQVSKASIAKIVGVTRAHHSPLYQDKAVTPKSLKDIYTNLVGTLSRPKPATNAAIVAACLNQGIEAIAV